MRPLFIKLFPDIVERHLRRRATSKENTHGALIAPAGQYTHIQDHPSTNPGVTSGSHRQNSGKQDDLEADLESLELPIRNVYAK